MCPLGRKGLSEASGFQPKGLCSGRGEAGRAVFLQVGLAWVSAVQMGIQPQTPPSAQLLCVLSSVRSDYLEVVHLLRVLRLSIFAFSPWAPELRRCHPLLTYSASGTLPGSVLSECWEAAGPLGHLGTPTTKGPSPFLVLEPGGGERAAPAAATCTWSSATARRARPEDLLLRGMVRAGWLVGPLRLPNRGQSCLKDVEVSS